MANTVKPSRKKKKKKEKKKGKQKLSSINVQVLEILWETEIAVVS